MTDLKNKLDEYTSKINFWWSKCLIWIRWSIWYWSYVEGISFGPLYHDDSLMKNHVHVRLWTLRMNIRMIWITCLNEQPDTDVLRKTLISSSLEKGPFEHFIQKIQGYEQDIRDDIISNLWHFFSFFFLLTDNLKELKTKEPSRGINKHCRTRQHLKWGNALGNRGKILTHTHTLSQTVNGSVTPAPLKRSELRPRKERSREVTVTKCSLLIGCRTRVGWARLPIGRWALATRP